MAVTHMRVSQLPERVDLNKLAVPVVLNTAIPIAEQTDLTVNNNSGFKAERLDSFKFQVSNDGGTTWSNEGTVTINDFAETNTPDSTNRTLTTTESTSTNLITPTDLVPVNASTDRIKITALDTLNGLLKYNGTNVSIGDVFFNYELTNLVFESVLGGGEPYQVVRYQCGNHLGYNATANALTVNVPLLAEVEFISRNTLNYQLAVNAILYDIVETTDVIKIKKGYIDKLADINFVISAPMYTDTTFNEIRINDESKVADETFNRQITFDKNGELLVEIKHIFVNANNTTTSSTVTLTLATVDGSAGKVSGTNSYVSTVNYN